MKYEVSLSIGAFQGALGDIAALDAAKAIGLTCVDFDLLRYDCAKAGNLYTKSEDEIASHFEAVRRHGEEIGVRIGQTHGRIKGWIYDDAHNENETKGARLDAMATRLLGTRCCVVHSVHLGPQVAGDEHSRLNDCMFDTNLPFAKENGIKIATETFGDSRLPDGRADIDFFGRKTEFINAYNKISQRNDNAPYFCTCMDTGHTNKAFRFEGQPSPQEMILALGNSIECLHLNDNDCMTDQHKMPLSGNIDWTAVLGALREVGYEGSYNMELSLERYGKSLEMVTAYAEFSVKVMKNLLCEVYGG